MCRHFPRDTAGDKGTRCALGKLGCCGSKGKHPDQTHRSSDISAETYTVISPREKREWKGVSRERKLTAREKAGRC